MLKRFQTGLEQNKSKTAPDNVHSLTAFFKQTNFMPHIFEATLNTLEN